MLRLIAIVIFTLSFALLILLGCVAHYTEDTCVNGCTVAILGALIGLCAIILAFG